MTLHELVEQLLEVAREPELWTTQHIADYLHRTAGTVRNRIILLDGFPKPISLPSEKDGPQRKLLWKSSEIKAWVLKHQGANSQ